MLKKILLGALLFIGLGAAIAYMQRSNIALALVDTHLSLGDQVSIDIRGRASTATIVEFPFVPSHVR